MYCSHSKDVYKRQRLMRVPEQRKRHAAPLRLQKKTLRPGFDAEQMPVRQENAHAVHFNLKIRRDLRGIVAVARHIEYIKTAEREVQILRVCLLYTSRCV